MPSETYHESIRHAYVTYMAISRLLLRDEAPEDEADFELLVREYGTDLAILRAISETRYLRERTKVPKASQIPLAWDFAANPAHYHRFQDMFAVSPLVFYTLLELIGDHAVFSTAGNVPQAPVSDQLMVTLYRLRHSGNGASVSAVARAMGYSEGGVEKFTRRCFDAIHDLHDTFVRSPTAEEKEVEKKWVEQQVGIPNSLWREGFAMYDGTIVVLSDRPVFHGESYFTRKSNYGLNVQVFFHPLDLVVEAKLLIGRKPAIKSSHCRLRTWLHWICSRCSSFSAYSSRQIP